MKPLLTGVTLFLLASLPALAANRPDEEAIRDRLASWTKAFNDRDADKVCDLFADDVVATVRGAPEAGKAEICGRLRKALAMPDRKLAYASNIHDIIISGDLAVVRLTWTLTMQQGGKTSVTTDEGMDVFLRDPDGVWRIHRYLAFAVERDE